MNGMTSPQTDIYQTGMPGGQYSNLQQQAKALGIDDFELVKQTYRDVNELLYHVCANGSAHQLFASKLRPTQRPLLV